MGSKLSTAQESFVRELYALVSKEGHPVTKGDLRDLVRTISEVTPWVPASGTFSLQDWLKIGTCFQGNPKVSLSVLYAWCKVRAALSGLTPANILFAQQEPKTPLPVLLPPVATHEHPSPPPTLPTPVPITEPESQPSAPPSSAPATTPPGTLLPPPYIPQPQPPPSAPPDALTVGEPPAEAEAPPPRSRPDPEVRVTPPVAAQLVVDDLYHSPVATAIVETPQCAMNSRMAFPVVRGQGGAADRYQPLDWKIVKQFMESIKENGLHAPYTRALQHALMDSKMLPYDWKLLAQAALTPAQFQLWSSAFSELAAKQGVENVRVRAQIIAALPADGDAAAVPPAITAEELAGVGVFGTATAQLRSTDDTLAAVGRFASYAFDKLPGGEKDISAAFSSIRQGAKEDYASFISRLLTATERQVDNETARGLVSQQLAFDNANQDCRAVLAPIYNKETTTITEMLRVCQNVGTIAHSAEVMVAVQAEQRKWEAELATEQARDFLSGRPRAQANQ